MSRAVRHGRSRWLAGLMLLQTVIEEERRTGTRARPEPSGDYSAMLPEGDPIRRELEALFPPFDSATAGPAIRSPAPFQPTPTSLPCHGGR